MLDPTRRKWLVVVGTALLVLILAGVVVSRLDRSKTEKVEAKSTLTAQATSQTVTKAELESIAKQSNEAFALMAAELKKTREEQVDLEQDVERQIIRYTASSAPQVITVPGTSPQPTSAPSGPVIVLPGATGQPATPAPVSGSTEPRDPIYIPAPAEGVPVEIVREIIRSRDRSKTTEQTEEKVEEKKEEKAETEVKVEEKKEEKKTEEVKVEEKTEVKVEKKEGPGGGKEVGRVNPLGIGVTSTATPFVSYDFIQKPLVLKLGRVGAGAFVSKPLTGGGIDFGPQINLTPGKSNIGIFGMYGIQSKTPMIGVGIKF